MSILFIMIPMAIVLVAVAIGFFFWATNNKQFDDLDSPAYRMLLDDERDAVMQANKAKTTQKTSQPLAETEQTEQIAESKDKTPTSDRSFPDTDNLG